MIIQKSSIFVAFGGEKLWKYEKYKNTHAHISSHLLAFSPYVHVCVHGSSLIFLRKFTTIT